MQKLRWKFIGDTYDAFMDGEDDMSAHIARHEVDLKQLVHGPRGEGSLCHGTIIRACSWSCSIHISCKFREFVIHVFLLVGKKIENVFRFFEFRLEINFSHFPLRRFEEVESRLGSLEAGVEIGTG